MLKLTIKQRLVISNIAMIVLPMILTIAMSFTIALVVFGFTGSTPNSNRGNNLTFITEEEQSENLAVDDYTKIGEDIVVYRSNEGEYVFVLPNDEQLVHDLDFSERNLYSSILILSMLIIIVFITNSFLTRMVFRSIMTPIENLVNGVHEIRDGNLNYRIVYEKKDEFEPICSDFNEMASRLSEMVIGRQKDEQNRRELIAGISHDLRTPLTSIKAYVEGLEKGVATTPEVQQKYLNTIKNKTGDLEYIINQLFLFSKLDTGEFPLNLECINIGDAISEMIEYLTEEYKDQGLHVLISQAAENVYCNVDIVQFRNVLQNIFGNSVKYKKKDEVTVTIFSSELEEEVLIKISDNGPGISESATDKLFDVFYREDPSRKNSHSGSGLGLAITAKIIERFDGSIMAENNSESGLSIIIRLPKVKETENYEKNTDN